MDEEKIESAEEQESMSTMDTPDEEPDILDQLSQSANEDNKDNPEDNPEYTSSLDQQSEAIKKSEEGTKADLKSLLKTNDGLFFERNKVLIIIIAIFIAGIIFFAVFYPELKTKKKKTNTETEKRGNVYIPSVLADPEDIMESEDGNSATTTTETEQEDASPAVKTMEQKYPPIIEEHKAPIKTNSSVQTVEVPLTNRNEQQKQIQRLSFDDFNAKDISGTNKNMSSYRGSYGTASYQNGNSSPYVPASLSANLAQLNGQVYKYEQQNNQSNKQQFAEKNAGQTNFQWNSDYSLWKGTVINGVLDTGVNTDLPGQLMAHVTKNVYSSKDGTYLLIPQGSRLYGEYNSMVSYGQVRVQVVWNTLIRPDGLEISLGSMSGIDKYGVSGYKGFKTEHPFEWVKAMGLIAMFSIFDTKMTNTINSQSNQYAQNALSDAYTETKQMSNKILERAMDIQPTITIKAGTEINLITNLTIDLPPLEDQPVNQKYIRR